jgi:predicted Zn-dependent protease
MVDLVKSLESPDNFHLSAAEGWLGLGNWHEANAELENIAVSSRDHPDVLEVRWQIFSKAGQWDKAAEVAEGLIKAQPEEPQFWISHAYATRRKSSGGIPKAQEILTKAQAQFPQEPLIAYNLACYACQLGDHDKARHWLKSAFALGNYTRLKRMALEDPDLEALHAEIEKG